MRKITKTNNKIAASQYMMRTLNFFVLGALRFTLLIKCVQCLPSTTVDPNEVRLIGGPDAYEGRVEVWQNNQWTPICRDSWDLTDAHIVCRQLGFEHASGAVAADSYGSGNSTAWLRDVECAGTEPSLQDCDYSVSDDECTREAGIICASGISIRLVDGEDVYSGRLEILYRGQWGTVCNDNWDELDAQVVCGMLGAPGVQSAMTYYGPGTGPIWLDNVECHGDEESIADCKFLGWGKHDCAHHYDVGLSCRDVRLVGGSNSMEGRVSIHHDGSWGSVCDHQWDTRDAEVVCKQLGFKSAFKATGAAAFGEGSGPIFLDDVQCSGEESALRDCYHRGWGQNVCQHSQDAGVICDEVRLVGGTGDHEGRLEILHNNVWGSVCNDAWDYTDARIVCRQLGYEDALYANVGIGEYGEGTGPIWLDEVACNGDERRLVECGRSGWNVTDCNHSEDVGIVCVTSYTLRLERGSQASGRVEVLYEGEWGTVCDFQWDIADAIVACQYLGFPGASWPTSGGNYGEGSGPVWMSGVQCTGMEGRLQDCSQSAGDWGVNECDHSRDAGVVCVPEIPDTEPPEIMDCPSDILTTVEYRGASEVPVAWRQPIASDNSMKIPSVDISHPPGSLFPIGTTLVSYTFEDESQNQAVCTFVVTVEELTPTTVPSTTTQLPTTEISSTTEIRTNTTTSTINYVSTTSNSPSEPFNWNLIIYVAIPLGLSVLLVLLLACVAACVCTGSKPKTPKSTTESRKGLYLAADVPSTEFEMMSAYSNSTSRTTMEGRRLPCEPHDYEVDPPDAETDHQYDDTDSGHYEALPPLRDEHGYLVLYDEPPKDREEYLVPDKRLSATPNDLVVYSERPVSPDTPPESLFSFQNGGYESSLGRTAIESRQPPTDLRNVSPLALLSFQNGGYKANRGNIAQTTQRQPEQKDSKKDKEDSKHEKLKRTLTAPL